MDKSASINSELASSMKLRHERLLFTDANSERYSDDKPPVFLNKISR
jgi:hypothetical protein